MKSEKKSFVKNKRFNAVKKLKEKDIIAGDIEHVIESQLPVDPLETVKSLQSGTDHEKLLSCLAIQRFSADKVALKELMKVNVLDIMLEALAATNNADVTIALLDSITAISSIDRGFALELLKRNVLPNFPQLIEKVNSITSHIQLGTNAASAYHLYSSLLETCPEVLPASIDLHLQEFFWRKFQESPTTDGLPQVIWLMASMTDDITWLQLDLKFLEDLATIVGDKSISTVQSSHIVAIIALVNASGHRNQRIQTFVMKKAAELIKLIASPEYEKRESVWEVADVLLSLLLDYGFEELSHESIEEDEEPIEPNFEMEMNEGIEVMEDEVMEKEWENIPETSKDVADSSLTSTIANSELIPALVSLFEYAINSKTDRSAAAYVCNRVSFVIGYVLAQCADVRLIKNELPLLIKLFINFCDVVLSGLFDSLAGVCMESLTSTISAVGRCADVAWPLVLSEIEKQAVDNVLERAYRAYAILLEAKEMPESLSSASRTNLVMLIGIFVLDSRLSNDIVAQIAEFLVSRMHSSGENGIAAEWSPQVIAESINAFIDLFGPDTYNQLFDETRMLLKIIDKPDALRKVVKSIDPRPSKVRRSELDLIWDESLLPSRKEVRDRLWDMCMNLNRFIAYKSGK